MIDPKPNSYSKNPNEDKSYLYPNVCLECRKSFKMPHATVTRVCTICGEELVELSRKFKVPKASNTDEWKKVKYLVSNGFRFYTQWKHVKDGCYEAVSYPRTMKDAIEFVKTYKDSIQS